MERNKAHLMAVGTILVLLLAILGSIWLINRYTEIVICVLVVAMGIGMIGMAIGLIVAMYIFLYNYYSEKGKNLEKGKYPSWESDRNRDELLSVFIEQFQITPLHEVGYSKQDLFKEVCSFRSLSMNWDGYGAIPVEAESAANAMLIISKFDNNIYGRIEHVFPNPNGTVSIIWENSKGETVSLEVGNKSISYYTEVSYQDTEYFDNIEINDKEISKLSTIISKIV